jgi:hypothetical protein
MLNSNIVCFAEINNNSELDNERNKELAFFKKAIDNKKISTACRDAINNLVKKTIRYNIAFDNYLNSISTKSESEYQKDINDYDQSNKEVKSAEKYIEIMCSTNDIKIIKSIK